jgi:predicted small lipoprotein YifL
MIVTDYGWRLFMKICWAQYLLWLAVAITGAGSALTACGQKGALYHPDSTAAVKGPLVAKDPITKKMPSASSEPSS